MRQKVIVSFVGDGPVYFWVDEVSFTDSEDLRLCTNIQSRDVDLGHGQPVKLVRLSYVQGKHPPTRLENFPVLTIAAAESDE